MFVFANLKILNKDEIRAQYIIKISCREFYDILKKYKFYVSPEEMAYKSLDITYKTIVVSLPDHEFKNLQNEIKKIYFTKLNNYDTKHLLIKTLIHEIEIINHDRNYGTKSKLPDNYVIREY